MQDTFWIDQVIEIIQKKVEQSPEPMTQGIVSLYGRDPYLILISCLLSLQARDVVTLPVSQALFKKVRTPQEMFQISQEELETIIRPVNYFKTKAKRLKSVSRELINRFNGRVPKTLEELSSIKGVGLKTANLVLAEAFEIPAICVDTHVHRLSNHWGIVQTKTPEQTERALQKTLPQNYWIDWNYYLVKWGQQVCKTKNCTTAECKKIQHFVTKNNL